MSRRPRGAGTGQGPGPRRRAGAGLTGQGGADRTVNAPGAGLGAVGGTHGAGLCRGGGGAIAQERRPEARGGGARCGLCAGRAVWPRPGGAGRARPASPSPGSVSSRSVYAARGEGAPGPPCRGCTRAGRCRRLCGDGGASPPHAAGATLSGVGALEDRGL